MGKVNGISLDSGSATQHEPRACDAALSRAFGFLGKRWSGVILGTLMSGPAGFAELRRAVTGISDSMLSERLAELSGAGLVQRSVDDGPPITVEYQLTAVGRALLPAISELTSWAQQHLPASANRLATILNAPTDASGLDHVVFGAPDLAAAVELVADLTGLRAVPGGRHLGLGTANYLLGLGGSAYLEIIGPDLEQPEPDRPRPFGVDDLVAPRVVTWAVRPADFDRQVRAARAAGHDVGEVAAMSRETPGGDLLAWRLTDSAPAPGDGLVPFLIDRGTSTHPTRSTLPPLRMLALRATHPRPRAIVAAVTALGARLDVGAGNRVALTLVVEGPAGVVELT